MISKIQLLKNIFSRKYKIYLNGGIGNQIISLLIQFEEVIKKKILISNLEIIICKYPIDDSKNIYHNTENILDYIIFEKGIQIKVIYPRKSLYKTKLNIENANKIIFSLKNDYKKYFKLNSKDFNNNKNKKVIMWIRGLERKFNIKEFEKVAINHFKDEDFGILTNDYNLLKKSKILSHKIIGGTPKTDFDYLNNTSLIVSQFSGFSIVPFLLSSLKQEFFLLSKKSHLKNEFPHIDKDWIFIKYLLDEFCKTNPKKNFRVLD